ncbi:sideroflexin-1 [Schistocerca piceifrons]|uniref:sideroflexin-1 n=1 Tax=Schistocerca piceifrons TaxID=274613 RepID=UPI001F5E97C0|nr:sideroflexin-1 [Schistocerca piceifrons]XP_049778914.1 sideroflexin-1 [Schistocerca cancellata]
MTPRINLNEPRWDQSTYWGRVRHFFAITNPLNILASEAELNRAKEIVETYKAGGDVGNLTEDELWRAKELYDSAFHPDTGEKMMLIGRMSAQVPMNMTITGCMMTFYKSTGAVVFWQWVNQSFNALVNYTNRSGDSPVTNTQLASSYVLATGGALTTALSLNRLVKSFPPIIGRFVPFVAVAAANCVNIPMMRLQELREGVPVADQDGKRIGNSKVAAQYGIAAVTFSRIAMATPGMAITPFVMDRLEKRGVLQRFPWSSAPIQTLLCGFFLTFATPMCCALFSQKASIATASLEPELQEKIKKMPNPPSRVYFNKGL